LTKKSGASFPRGPKSRSAVSRASRFVGMLNPRISMQAVIVSKCFPPSSSALKSSWPRARRRRRPCRTWCRSCAGRPRVPGDAQSRPPADLSEERCIWHFGFVLLDLQLIHVSLIHCNQRRRAIHRPPDIRRRSAGRRRPRDVRLIEYAKPCVYEGCYLGHAKTSTPRSSGARPSPREGTSKHGASGAGCFDT
jgi:hypothetical protein